MAFVAVAQFFHDGLAEHAFAFAVDEDDFEASVAEVGVHDFAEFVYLKIEHVGVGEACGGVDDIGSVFSVNSVLTSLRRRARIRRRVRQ